MRKAGMLIHLCDRAVLVIFFHNVAMISFCRGGSTVCPCGLSVLEVVTEY